MVPVCLVCASISDTKLSYPSVTFRVADWGSWYWAVICLLMGSVPAPGWVTGAVVVSCLLALTSNIKLLHESYLGGTWKYLYFGQEVLCWRNVTRTKFDLLERGLKPIIWSPQGETKYLDRSSSLKLGLWAPYIVVCALMAQYIHTKILYTV